MRLRFAPSPTGPFHIGGARSALFNWLLVKRYGGQFVLRVEDTDRERSTMESEKNIEKALQWLGITWDEGPDIGGDYGPYRQTERLSMYEKYTEQLLAENKVYRCYCTEEMLDQDRKEQMDKGETPRYTGRCRNLSQEERAELESAGKTSVVRFAVPAGQEIVIDDQVRGKVTFDSDGVGDFVIVKSDGIPVYNYAVVLDDALMKITHVVRAEEHLSNTPRQVVLYDALGFLRPTFAHVSLILGKDKTKMSKRHGATSVDQYRSLGYLPEAIVNFLALLGWSPEGEEEIFSTEELIERFSLDRVAKNPAVFDVDKLNYINAHYLRQLNIDELYELVAPHLTEAGYIKNDMSEQEVTWLKRAVWLVREHLSYGAQILEHMALFFQDDVAFENEEVRALIDDPEIKENLQLVYALLESMEESEFCAANIQKALKALMKEKKIPGKKIFMPVRIAVTGCAHGPDLFEIIDLFGKEKVLQRLAQMP